MSALEELTRLAGSVSNAAVEGWKQSGKKTVGFLCSHVPEEILYAAEILPVRLRAPGCTETTSADRYLSHLNCTYVRSCLEFINTGQFDFLDGFVGTSCCDHARRFYDILRETRRFDFLHLIDVPRKVGGDPTTRFHAEEFGRFKQTVENAFGVQITETGLRRAVEVSNETRRLLAKLYDLRKSQHPPLTGAEALSVVVAGFSLPKEEYNLLLERLLEELDGRTPVSEYTARLMIAGSGGLDNPEYLRMMEDLGGLIVTDSLCYGSRSFFEPVPTGGDLVLNLARSYLTRPSCATMTDRTAERADFIIQMARDFNVDGVIFQRMRYCDLWGGQLLYVRKRLKEASIPLLSLEREYATQGEEQLRTRVQAFLEQIGR